MLRDRGVFVDAAARDADRADAASVAVDERLAAAERDEPAVTVFDAAQRAVARHRAERAGRRAEAHRRQRLALREIGRAEKAVVGAHEREQVRAGIDDGDRDAGYLQRRGMREGRVDRAAGNGERQRGGERVHAKGSDRTTAPV